MLAMASLSRSFANTLDGSLTVPASFDGMATLLGTVTLDGTTIRVEREVAITGDARSGDPPEPRRLRSLQQFSMGPIHAIGEAHPPEPMHVRVRGGACVPELPCDLTVHVGEPGAAIGAKSTASVSIVGPAQSAHTARVAAFTALVMIGITSNRAPSRGSPKTVTHDILL